MNLLWAPWRIRFILEGLKEPGCVFCKAIRSNDDSKHLILHRSEHSFTILNKYPYNSGHLMVVPNRHTGNFTDLSVEELSDIHQEIQRAVLALTDSMRPQGFNVGMNIGEAGGAGIRDHLHYHVVPRWNGDTNYLPVLGETKVLPEGLEETCARILQVYKKTRS
ncbi:MAG: HIT domain-containing protein [Pseudomonadota bacterium]